MGNSHWQDKSDLALKVLTSGDYVFALVNGAIKQCADLAKDDLEGMPRFFICAEEIICLLSSVIPNFGVPSPGKGTDVQALSDSIRLNYLQNFGWSEDCEYAFAFYTVNLQRVLLMAQSATQSSVEQLQLSNRIASDMLETIIKT